MVVLVVNLPCTDGRPVGLPILLRLFRPKDDEHPDRASQPEVARLLIDKAIAQLPGRAVALVMDGAYASCAWRALPDRVALTTRMRSTAALYEPAPGPTGKRGRPALKGARRARLAQIAETATFTAVTITSPDGRQRTAHVHRFGCLWYGLFHTQPITVLMIRNPATNEGFDIALASTDTTAETAALITGYDTRWTIETCHQEAKAHGVGEARNRVQRAVERTVPFGFLTQTITIAWYQLHGNPATDLVARRRNAPWYPHKTTVSYTDMLAALRREIIRAEFHAETPAPTTTPQISGRPSPSALTAA
ncbi:MAG: transposase [Solirubrobacteraceae bacterium]